MGFQHLEELKSTIGLPIHPGSSCSPIDIGSIKRREWLHDRTIRQAKAQWSELVELASQGEEILITVDGKPKARLVGVPSPDDARAETRTTKLPELRAKYSTGKSSMTTEEILDELREERL